jgi:aminoglycoside phosphotransferase (APT) family kinase protein
VVWKKLSHRGRHELDPGDKQRRFAESANLRRYSVEEVRAIVGRALPTLATAECAEIGEGGDFSTWRVGDNAIAKLAPDEEARRALRREVVAASMAQQHVKVPVPTCLYAPDGDRGGVSFALFSWLGGESLQRLRLDASSSATLQLIEFVEDLHAIDVGRLDPLFTRGEDRGTPSEAFERAARWRDLLKQFPKQFSQAASDFLAGRVAVPEVPSRQAVFSHADLKGEHILIGPDGSVSGVVDWADAAIQHPLDDYVGLVIGAGLAVVSEAIRGRQDEDLIPIAAHYARCAGVNNLGGRLAGESTAPIDLLIRQLERAFEPARNSDCGLD